MTVATKQIERVNVDELEATFGGLFTPGLLREVSSHASTKYRKRLLTIEVVLLGLISFVLKGLDSFKEIVDRLRMGNLPGLMAVEVTPSAFYQRLGTLSHTLFLDLLHSTSVALSKGQKHRRSTTLELAPFATRIIALDDTTLDALMRRAKWLKEYKKGDWATLAGRLGCALDLVTGRFAEIIYDEDAKANEKNHAKPLIERLPAGSLYVFDLGYFSFPFFDYLSEKFCYFVTRLRKKATFKVVEVLADGPLYRDRVVYLGKYRADQAAHPVRLVELLIKGTWYRYLTNVLNPQVLPAPKVWALYAQRWNIEMAFAAVKRALKMAFLRATHQNGILIQIWSTLTAYQVLQDLRLEIAQKSGWKDDDVSWQILMRTISWYPESRREWPLRTWLIKNAEKAGLKKRGVRKRKDDGLPTLVLEACLPPPPSPHVGKLTSRRARQGKPEPRKTSSITILACLA